MLFKSAVTSGPAQSLESRFSYCLSTLCIPKMSTSLQSLLQHQQMIGKRGKPRLPDPIRNGTLPYQSFSTRPISTGEGEAPWKRREVTFTEHLLCTACLPTVASIHFTSSPQIQETTHYSNVTTTWHRKILSGIRQDTQENLSQRSEA